MLKRRKIFYGWWIAITAAFLNVVTGGTFIYAFTIFFNPIRRTFGWSAAITSIAFSLRGLETGLLDPIVGYLVDKLGPRKLIFCGWLAAGLGFLLMSRINSLWTFYGSFIVIGAGFSFGTFVVFNAAVANWFIKKRSRALTLMYVGFGVSGVLVPLVAWSIEQFGWRDTAIYVGILLWLIGLPLSLVMRHKPEQYGYLPDGETGEITGKPRSASSLHSSTEITEQGSSSSATEFTAKEAIRSRPFWLLSMAYFFQHIATSAVMVHIVPYLESMDVPTAIAATVVTGMTLGSLIGRLGFGLLGDFFNKRYLISISFALQVLGVFIFAYIDGDKVWLLIPFLITYGAGFGGTIPLRPALLADYFGTRSFGTIFGWVALIGMLGGVASPVIAGWIFDITGSYQLAWQIFALTTVPAIPLILLAKPPRAK
ncbi:L-lactate transporter [subsurface metagenome]